MSEQLFGISNEEMPIVKDIGKLKINWEQYYPFYVVISLTPELYCN